MTASFFLPPPQRRPADSRSPRRLIAIAAGVVIAILAFVVLGRHLTAIDPQAIFVQIRSYAATQLWLAGLLVTAYVLLNSVNEVWIVRVLKLPVRGADATVIAAIANPVGHAIGFSTFTAGALRYRLYASFTVPARGIAAIVVLGTLPFLLAAIALIGATFLTYGRVAAQVLQTTPLLLNTLGAIGLLTVIACIAAANHPTSQRILDWALRQSAPPALGSAFVSGQLVVGILEVVLVAATLFVFLPDTGLPFGAFLGVYLIAVVLGQLSVAPAGLGVLEASMLLMLPQVDSGQLLASLLAYRFFFEVLPLLLGMSLWAMREIRALRRQSAALR